MRPESNQGHEERDLGICGGPKVKGYRFGDPYKMDYNIFGSVLGSPYSRKLPYSTFSSAGAFTVGGFCFVSVGQ